VLAVLAVLLGFGMKHEYCETCLIQQYVKSLFGFHIRALSEFDYDEYGTYETFEKTCGDHVHRFVLLSSARAIVLQSKPENELAELAHDFVPRCAESNRD